MNLFHVKKFKPVIGRIIALLAVCIVFQVRGAESPVPGRWLLVFDTSATMKKCLPGTEAALRNFFSTSADGQLQPGDSVAVWLVNQQINGQFPTFAAGATNSGFIVSNLVGFLNAQRYSSTSQLAGLQIPLNHVVTGSRRLTVILFTDGQSDMVGTPYDDGINQTFRDVQADRRKNQQPVLVVMRSQMGKFAGCTLGFPPGDVSFPPFPALPAPPVVTNVVKATAPPVTPPPAAASLVIVGNKVITSSNTNQETHASLPPPLMASNPPPVAPSTNLPAIAATAINPPASAPVITSNPPPALTANLPITAPAATNPPVAAPVIHSNLPPAKMESMVVAPPAIAPDEPKPEEVAMTTITAVATNPTVATVKAGKASAPGKAAVAVSKEPSVGRPRIHIFAGLGAVAAAVVLGMILLARSRRPDASLISRSMENDPRRK